MQVDQFLRDPKRSLSFALSIDFDALHLSCMGLPEAEIDQRFESLEALEAVFRERIAPVYCSGRCWDGTRGKTVRPIGDLASWAEELRQAGFDRHEPSREPGDELEDLIADLVTQFRRELNLALGPEPTTLSTLVLVAGDSHIDAAFKDPPLLEGLDEEAIAAVIDRGRNKAWVRGEPLDFGFCHEETYVEPIEGFFDDPGEYGPESMIGALFDLVGARIEASPGLRDNVELRGPLRIFFPYHDQEYVYFERRALARSVGQTAVREYFERSAAQQWG